METKTLVKDKSGKFPTEEHNSVDEMMVNFKGKSTIKQYIRGKPNPWGFKLWGRAGISGFLYDFDVYQGASQNKSSELGVGGDIVMKLTETLEGGKNYKIFADNYFTSIKLAMALKERSMFYVGTVMSNRLKGPLKPKELKKEGRGTSEYRVDESEKLIVVRWYF